MGNEIEVVTAINWLNADTIRVTDYGNENTYYIDQFGNEFFCKNYPEQYGTVFAPASTFQ